MIPYDNYLDLMIYFLIKDIQLYPIMQEGEPLAQTKKLTLYTYFRSSTAWRVRISLNYKQIPHNFAYVHLFKGEQKTSDYKKINPNGSVPALLLPNGQIIIQSMAIIQYLQEAYPQNPLLPKDPIKKAQIRGFCQVINSGIHPYHNLRLLQKIETDYKGNKIQFASYWVARGLNTLQAMLQKTKGKYCFGDQITLADCFLYPTIIGGIARFGVQIDKYPHCKSIIQNLAQIQAFVQAEPKNQPDFEK